MACSYSWSTSRIPFSTAERSPRGNIPRQISPRRGSASPLIVTRTPPSSGDADTRAMPPRLRQHPIRIGPGTGAFVRELSQPRGAMPAGRIATYHVATLPRQRMPRAPREGRRLSLCLPSVCGSTLHCRWSPTINNGGGPTNGNYRLLKEREVSVDATGGTLYVNPRKRLTGTGSIGVQVQVSNKRLKGVRVSSAW